TQKKYDDADANLKPFETTFQESRLINKARVVRAKSLTQLGRYEESQRLLAAAANAKEIKSGDWAMQWQLTRGEDFVALQEYKEAIDPLEACLRAQPRGGEAVPALANLTVAKGRLKDLATAKIMFADFIDQKPPEELRLPVTQNLADAAFVADDRAWAA